MALKKQCGLVDFVFPTINPKSESWSHWKLPCTLHFALGKKSLLLPTHTTRQATSSNSPYLHHTCTQLEGTKLTPITWCTRILYDVIFPMCQGSIQKLNPLISSLKQNRARRSLVQASGWLAWPQSLFSSPAEISDRTAHPQWWKK